MITVFPSSLSGCVKAPPSKSCSHRALICAALSKSPVKLSGLSKCDDVMLTLHCLEALGACYKNGILTPIDRSNLPVSPTLNCGESGSTLRFLLPIVAALGCGADFVLGERLAKRPNEELCKELIRHGADIKSCGNLLSIRGKIGGGTYYLPGNISSQYISGLLLALPLSGGGEVNITTGVKSSDYIDITIEFLKRSNIYVNRTGSKISVCGEYTYFPDQSIEGDWSAAAFWLCAAAMGNGNIEVSGLDFSSVQGDRKILPILRQMGHKVDIGGSIKAPTAPPHSIEIDATDIPDLVPPLAVLCTAAKGESRIFNTKALRTKESDRLEALYIMLTSMGIDAKLFDDELRISGGILHGASLSAFSDHRIAMAAVIAASCADSPSTLDDTDCIAKSYPDFLSDFISLGGKIS